MSPSLAGVVWHAKDSLGQPLAGVLITGKSALFGDWQGLTNDCGDFFSMLSPGQYDVTFHKDGYKDNGYHPATIGDPGKIECQLDRAVGPYTRDQIINIQANFCNLWDSNDVPIFDIFFSDVITNHPDTARDWFTVHKNARSSHIVIALSGDYPENLGWAPRYPFSGHDWTNDILGFSRILDRIISEGFIPIIELACDGQSYDSGGMTYGWQWGMDNLPRILPQLSRFKPYSLFSTGFDGCFPDWNRDQTIQFLTMLRKTLGDDGYIATEFSGPGSVGYCHMGQAGADWTYDKLGLLDAFLVEIMTYPPNEEGVAQTATRLLGPNALNTPTTPYYLSGLKKTISMCYFESIAFQAIRKQVSPADARKSADRGKYYGFTSFGNGLPH